MTKVPYPAKQSQLASVPVLAERFNVHQQIRRILEADSETALRVLPAMAGEILAGGDTVTVAEMSDALGMWVLDQGPNHRVAEAVLAMVRAYAIGGGARSGRGKSS